MKKLPFFLLFFVFLVGCQNANGPTSPSVPTMSSMAPTVEENGVETDVESQSAVTSTRLLIGHEYDVAELEAIGLFVEHARIPTVHNARFPQRPRSEPAPWEFTLKRPKEGDIFEMGNWIHFKLKSNRRLPPETPVLFFLRRDLSPTLIQFRFVGTTDGSRRRNVFLRGKVSNRTEPGEYVAFAIVDNIAKIQPITATNVFGNTVTVIDSSP